MREAKRGADAFIRELNRVRQAERASTGGAGGGFGSQLSALTGGRFALAGGGAVAGVGALAVGFAAAAREGVNYRETLERLNKSFETLTGSVAAAGAHVKELQDFAAKTPFEFEDVAHASQRFQNMGVAAKDVIPLLTAVGNAVAAAGGSSEQIDRVTLAISQMSAKGKVSAEEMNQLAEAGVGGWRLLEQQLGKSKGELMKMAEQGEISSDTFIKAFRQQYEAGNAMQKQMETLTGATSTLKDKSRELLAQAFTPLHAVLRDTAVELAKISTEGFNAQRGLMAAASVFRSGFSAANLGGGDNLLIGLALQQGGPQLAVAVQALLRGGAKPGGGGTWGEAPINIPEEFKYKQKISDEDLIKANKRGAEEWLKQHEKELEDATRKANRESERQSDIIGRISKDFAEASTRVSGFSGDALQLEAALYKLSIGFSTLSDANKAAAQAEVNRLFSAKRELERLQAADDLQKSLNASIDGWTIALRGGETERDRVLTAVSKFVDSGGRADETLRKLTARALHFAAQKDFEDFVTRVAEQMERIASVPVGDTSDFKLPGDRWGNEGPWVDPSNAGTAPPNVAAEMVRRRQEMMEVGEDLADIFSNVFESIEGGWKGMWQEMLNVARTTLQEISRDLLRMALTGQKSGAGGIIGLAANWLGSALFGGGGLPTAGASKMGGSYLQPTIPGLASGTMNAKPGLHLVGERGPELVDFRGGEQVFNNRDSRRMMGGTVINKTTIINYQPRVTPDSYASRRSNRETFEALLSFAR